jgi:hypothetical protein
LANALRQKSPIKETAARKRLQLFESFGGAEGDRTPDLRIANETSHLNLNL